MKLLVSLITLFSLHGRVFANTEKVIFVAPPAPLEPLEYHRALATLTPSNPVAHKIQVQLSFEAPTQTFFSLESLDIGRTYEVRVCWPAMVPPRPWERILTLCRFLQILNLSLSLRRIARCCREDKLKIERVLQRLI